MRRDAERAEIIGKAISARASREDLWDMTLENIDIVAMAEEIAEALQNVLMAGSPDNERWTLLAGRILGSITAVEAGKVADVLRANDLPDLADFFDSIAHGDG